MAKSHTMEVNKVERNAHEAAKLLRAISNPQRLLILCHLAQGEKSVGELEGQMNISQPRLSQQLARLRRDGVVRTRRDSRTIYYALDDGRAESLIGHLYQLFCAASPSERSDGDARAAEPARAPHPGGFPGFLD